MAEHGRRNRYLRAVLATAGGITALAYMAIAIAVATPEGGGMRRFLVLLYVGLAFVATGLLAKYLRDELSGSAGTWVDLARQTGLILLFVLGVVTCYALAYGRVGLIYTAETAPATVGGVVYFDARDALTRNAFDAVYFSIITLTTVGYGDFRPTPTGRGIAAIEALNGYFVLGLVVFYLTAKLQGAASGREHARVPPPRPSAVPTPEPSGEASDRPSA